MDFLQRCLVQQKQSLKLADGKETLKIMRSMFLLGGCGPKCPHASAHTGNNQFQTQSQTSVGVPQGRLLSNDRRHTRKMFWLFYGL
jgi:hypothetical protein